MLTNQLWLVTVPNNKENPESAFATLQSSVAANGQCKLYRFQMPPLVVGTLDSLIALSDDMGKINNQVEVLFCC